MYPQEPSLPNSNPLPFPYQNQTPPSGDANPPQSPNQNPAPNNSVDPTPSKHENINPLSVMEPGEQMICEVKRHPIGMLGIYIMSGLVMIVLAILAFLVAPNIITNTSRSDVILGGFVIFLLVSVVVMGFVFVAHKVYWGNSWVVTSDSITEITQTSLFNKQSSQLSLGNLEDVTTEQDGLLPHLLNYGRVRVETAGERSKFLFPFCPNPSYYAKQILAAREAFEQDRASSNPQRLFRDEGAYQQSYPSYQTPSPTPTYPEPAPPVNAYQLPAYPNGAASLPQPDYAQYVPPAPSPQNDGPYPPPSYQPPADTDGSADTL